MNLHSCKIVAWILAGLAGLLLLALLAIRLLVDPNAHKAELQAAFLEATGRDLALAGPLQLSIFPWLAVATNDASVGNRAGFGAGPFARLGHARLGLRLWPLLSAQRLEVGPVEVSQIEVNFVVAADGRDNWSDLFEQAERTRSARTVEDDAAAESTAYELSIASLELRQARVSFRDERTAAHYVISDIELETGTLRTGKPVDVRTRLAISRNGKALGKYELETRLDGSQAGVLALVDAQGTILLPRSNGAATPIEIRAPRIQYRAATNDIDAEMIEATVGRSTLRTSLQVRQRADGPRMRGSFTVPATDPRALLRALGLTVPRTRNPRALGRLEAKGDVAYSRLQGLQFNPLSLVLDETRIDGRIAIPDLDRNSIRFDLRANAVDIDRYLPPKGTASASAQGKGAPGKAPDFTALRKLDLEGKLALDRLQLAGVDLRKVDVGLRARGGRLQVDPFRASAFSGRTSSTLTVDVRQAVPAVHLEQRIEGVDVAAMLGQLLDLRQLQGRGRANFVLDTRGLEATALFDGLHGTFDLTVEDGVLLGADLGYEIERALGAAQLRPTTAVNTGRTPFRTLHGSGTLAQRTLHHRQLEFVSDIATARGGGDVDYGRNRLDLDLTARLLKVPPGRLFGIKLSRVENVDIPLAVTGPIDAPKVSPDVNALLQAVAKSSLQQPLEGKIKQGLKDLIGL